MKETRRWNESIDRAFGRGISGGTVIALPTRERAREVAERMRAADRGKPVGRAPVRPRLDLDDLVPPDQDDRLALLADIRRLLTKQTLAAMTDAEREAARALTPPAHLARIADADVPSELAWPFVGAGRHARSPGRRHDGRGVRPVAHRGSRALRRDVPRPGPGRGRGRRRQRLRPARHRPLREPRRPARVADRGARRGDRGRDRDPGRRADRRRSRCCAAPRACSCCSARPACSASGSTSSTSWRCRSRSGSGSTTR